MATDLPFQILDVFTDVPYAGNPLVVLWETDRLTSSEMQKVAAEFNLSESIFLAAPKNSLHTASARIFTPRRELPFAGHPIVGAATYLARKNWRKNELHEAVVIIECSIGPVRAAARSEENNVVFAEFDLPVLPHALDNVPSPKDVAAALCLHVSDIGFDHHRISRYSAGNSFVLVPVRSLEAAGRATIDPMLWQENLGLPSSCYIYTRECKNNNADLHARCLEQGLGIGEDPATGSAAAALLGALTAFDSLSDGMNRIRIEQGIEMGRPSIISLELMVSCGRLNGGRIGGHAIPVASGSVSV